MIGSDNNLFNFFNSFFKGLIWND